LSSHVPTSPLFPYTTLFRSDGVLPCLTHEPALDDGRRRDRHGRHSSHLHRRGVLNRDRNRLRPVAVLDPHLPGPNLARTFALPGDRKSTRLNSSHGSISYAV